jgi:CubicO group peptidase (beta-lactamase class C family)
MNLETVGVPEDVGLSSDRLERIAEWMQHTIDDRKLAGVTVALKRKGTLAFHRTLGWADIAREASMKRDTIVRIYSMTKPLTSVALMTLYEEGRFQLDDPISRFLPCFNNMRVFAGGEAPTNTVPAERAITFRDLLTHTSGLTYGFIDGHPVNAAYRDAGVDFQASEVDLGTMVERAATLPLLAQPGTQWNYSIATDVIGHLVEIISGKSFDVFLRERVIEPLGMVDTDFHVPPDKQTRFAANYKRGPDGAPELIDDPVTSRFLKPPALYSGGGGLVSTADDYLRFCQMMLNRGQLDGVRLLGSKTVTLMTSNHLCGDMAAMGQPRFSESNYEGIGFGLGFSVMLDVTRAQITGSAGECAWGGVASTAFWIDPAEELSVVLLTQLTPSSTYPIRRELRVLTYSAIVD